MFKKSVIAMAFMLAIRVHATDSEKFENDEIRQLQAQLKELTVELQKVKKCSEWTSEYVRCTIKYAPLRCVCPFAEMRQACENDAISDAWWRK